MRSGNKLFLLIIVTCSTLYLSSLIPSHVRADTLPTIDWSKTFGGPGSDWGESIQITSDGCYIIVGSTNSFGLGKSDVYLIKTDPEGNLEWNRTYGGSRYDEGCSVQETADGGYIIAGGTDSFGQDADVYLIKTDSEGNMLWNKTYGGSNSDVGTSVQITSDGGYIIVGSTKSDTDADVYMIKTDQKGNMLWNKTYGGFDEDRGRSVRVTGDGGFIIVGYTRSFGSGKSDVYLIKTDSEGNMLWSKTFGGSKADWGNSIQITNDGGYIIAGDHVSLGEGEGAGGSDVYLIKTDSDGRLQWKKTYGDARDETGSSIDESGYSVQVTGDGGYVIVGDRYLGLNRDIFLVLTDSNGHELWRQNYGSPLADVGKSVQVTSDGGCIIAGSTDSNSPNVFDVYLVKISPLLVEEQVADTDEDIPIYVYGVPIAFLALVIALYLQKIRKISASA